MEKVFRDITNFQATKVTFAKIHSTLSIAHFLFLRLVQRIRSVNYTRREEAPQTAKMGIKQLFSIIKEEAPEAIKEGEIKNQFGRKVAIVSIQ